MDIFPRYLGGSLWDDETPAVYAEYDPDTNTVSWTRERPDESPLFRQYAAARMWDGALRIEFRDWPAPSGRCAVEMLGMNPSQAIHLCQTMIEMADAAMGD